MRQPRRVSAIIYPPCVTTADQPHHCLVYKMGPLTRRFTEMLWRNQFRRPEDDMDDEEDVEALQDNGCMRGGGGSGGSGGARGGQRDEENEEENLGPLDRARLRA